MNALQLFALVVLPLAVAAAGWAVALAVAPPGYDADEAPAPDTSRKTHA